MAEENESVNGLLIITVDLRGEVVIHDNGKEIGTVQYLGNAGLSQASIGFRFPKSIGIDRLKIFQAKFPRQTDEG
jgi:hypothetical protein